jgi:ABC-type multidrug transport system fused ATPase/permease subunit
MLTYLLCFLLALILVFNIILSKYFVIPREIALIEAEDTVKSASQENLAQINLIRSYFATNEINQAMAARDTQLVYQEKSLWNANITMWSIIKMMYLITVFVLGTYVLHQIHQGNLTAVDGIAFMVMYIQGTYGIISLERPIRQATKSLTRIKDLFQFIPTFGAQTFKVLPSKGTTKQPTAAPRMISLAAENISFSYSSMAAIFDQHSLHLSVPFKQESKLYGIIGPSGMGKSTLLSILGGQLNPTTGSVTLNGINIYQIDDISRRNLIAMQGQVASSMRGTLRYNLLFGLPGNTIDTYSDEYLIDLLHRVGLWEIFKAKNGLETLIGEGGLTLSGGQRQRLNFASLYLRAHAYQPFLMLIDEPTSSLDELSEQAITIMMEELAQKALTLVIAHRIKTIEKAQAILDVSLINEQKEMIFYTQQELLSRSVYYQQLVRGAIALDE